MRFLFALLLLLPLHAEEQEELLPSTPEQLVTLFSHQEQLIAGLVSPLSGQLALQRTDLVVNGAEPLHLTRSYVPLQMPVSFDSDSSWDRYYLGFYLGSNYVGWQLFGHLRMEFYLPSEGDWRIYLGDPRGGILEFVFRDHRWQPAWRGGISNCAGEQVSGAYDLRNTQIELLSDRVIVQAPDGTRREYRSPLLSDYQLCYNKKGKAKCVSKKYSLRLEKETLPNGKLIKYHYHQDRLRRIESRDPHDHCTYAYFEIEGHPLDDYQRIRSSTGGFAEYRYESRSEDVITKKSKKRGRGRNKAHFIHPPFLREVSSPFYRHEWLDYCSRFLLAQQKSHDLPFHCEYSGPGHYRLHKLNLPVQEDGSYHSVHQFYYDPPVPGERGGHTRVEHTGGSKTIYNFSKELLITSIQHYAENGRKVREKLFHWSGALQLSSLELKDGEGRLLYRRDYKYDRFGNPTYESLTGNLTGGGGEEHFITLREFSQDGRHLLLREEDDEGRLTTYSYLPGTNLITSRQLFEDGTLLEEQLFDYDDCYNLIRKVEKDGSLAKETLYTLRQQQPFLHMPEWIEERALDGPLLQRTQLLYDSWGNICEEHIHGSDGKYAYSLHREYNERGDLLLETNPLGQRASYQYDERGRRTSATNFSSRLTTNLSYDARNREIERSELGDDGLKQTTHYRYDLLDHLVKETDPFGNESHHQYDPIHHKPKRSELPSLASGAVIIHTEYDALGRELAKTDPTNHTTRYSYNAYGSVTEILHPDGSHQQFRYSRSGKLLQQTDEDGRTIIQQLNLQGKPLLKRYLSPTGEELARETFQYDGSRLISETDREGYTTYYSYDSLGREIQRERCGRITEYSYDTLGRLATSWQLDGENSLITHYQRDLLGRVICESKTSIDGTLLHQVHYGYDADGNRDSITRSINGSDASEILLYDSFGRLTIQEDALGNRHQTSYDEKSQNELGQRILTITTLDPKGIATVETHDSHGNLVEKKRLAADAILSLEQRYYDPASNLLRQLDYSYQDGRANGLSITAYSYTARHRIKSLTRAFGSSSARTTLFSYYPSGRRATKTVPDGTTLSYSYDGLGYLKSIDSSDLHHTFQHNQLGKLLFACDELTGISLERELDPFGNILQERLSTGLTLQKQYDRFDRATLLILPDCSQIAYHYDPLFLRRVERFSSTGELLYSHSYDRYDLSGNPTEESLIGGLGPQLTSHDPVGRISSRSSPYHSQQCFYDPVGNLTATQIDNDKHFYSYDDLSQLTSEGSYSYRYDSLHSRIQKNEELATYNELQELLSIGDTHLTYDLNGNQTSKDNWRYSYDSLSRLTSATNGDTSLQFTYDPLGRRLSKQVDDQLLEYYLYDDNQELGAYQRGQPKNLRVLGLAAHKNSPTTIAIEIEEQAFAPLVDVQGNIRHLIDLDTAGIAASYDFTAFGEDLQKSPHHPSNPWRFASKRLDSELGLIYFGKRYYDPSLGRWLTTDPAGFVDSLNLYQYVWNNPFRYLDPHGENILGFLCGIGQILAGGAVMASGVALEVATLGGYTFALGFHEAAGFALMTSGYIQAMHHVKDLSMPPSYRTMETTPNWSNRLEWQKRKKEGSIAEEAKYPEQLEEDPDWVEITHPGAAETGKREFQNKKNGDKIRFDKGKPGQSGHGGHDHHHHLRPDGKGDYHYLDSKGNVVRGGSDAAHHYNPENVWWKS